MKNVTLKLEAEVEIKNKGVSILVEDSAASGQLVLGKASVLWFKKHNKKRAHKVKLEEFISWLESKPEVEAVRP
jgi:hypothetical protein